jgi:acylphosphatase
LNTNLHYSIKVSGRVQGVGYRAFAIKTATLLGIYGYVKNRPDGSVQIEAEGTESILVQFIKLCENGPGWGHVERVDFTESPVQGYHDFIIKY